MIQQYLIALVNVIKRKMRITDGLSNTEPQILRALGRVSGIYYNDGDLLVGQSESGVMGGVDVNSGWTVWQYPILVDAFESDAVVKQSTFDSGSGILGLMIEYAKGRKPNEVFLVEFDTGVVLFHGQSTKYNNIYTYENKLLVEDGNLGKLYKVVFEEGIFKLKSTPLVPSNPAVDLAKSVMRPNLMKKRETGGDIQVDIDEGNLKGYIGGQEAWRRVDALGDIVITFPMPPVQDHEPTLLPLMPFQSDDALDVILLNPTIHPPEPSLSYEPRILSISKHGNVFYFPESGISGLLHIGVITGDDVDFSGCQVEAHRIGVYKHLVVVYGCSNSGTVEITPHIAEYKFSKMPLYEDVYIFGDTYFTKEEGRLVPTVQISPKLGSHMDLEEYNINDVCLHVPPPNDGYVEGVLYSETAPGEVSWRSYIGKDVLAIAKPNLKEAVSRGELGGKYNDVQFIVKNDGTTISKYLTDSLIYYSVADMDAEGQQVVNVIGLNIYNGQAQVTYRLPKDSHGPISMYRDSNVVYIQYWNTDPGLGIPRWQLDALEVVEATEYQTRDLLKNGVFGKAEDEIVDIAKMPRAQVMARTYLLPDKIIDFEVTKTMLGITPKEIAIHFRTSGSLVLPSHLLSARRPIPQNAKGEVPDADHEVGLYPYVPLPIQALGNKLYLNYPLRHLTNMIVNDAKIVSSASSIHESSSHIYVYASGMFSHALRKPAGHYDTVPPTLDVVGILAVLAAMITVLSLGSKIRKYRSPQKE